MAAYFLSKSAQTDPAMHSALQSIFSTAEAHVGLVICERLVNMPVQIIPPMYSMLLEELRNALSAVRVSCKFLPPQCLFLLTALPHDRVNRTSFLISSSFPEHIIFLMTMSRHWLIRRLPVKPMSSIKNLKRPGLAQSLKSAMSMIC